MARLRSTLRRPLALLVLTAAIAGGVLVFWWLLPLGLLALAVMALLDVPTPASAGDTRRSVITSPTLRQALTRIDHTEREIAQSVAQTSGALRRILSPIASQARELAEQARDLGQQGQILAGYLSGTAVVTLQQQIFDLSQRIARTSDAYTRQQLEETHAVLLTRQRHRDELRVYSDRIEAQLEHIAASLENIHTETIRLRTTDAASAGHITDQLRDLKADMRAFLQVLDTALGHAAG